MNKELLLRKIANTIVCNLYNSNSIGLFHGSMGTCLFLYAYAHYTKKEWYEEWANLLLNNIYNTEIENISTCIKDGYSGIGIGLCWLLRNKLIERNVVEILEDIDEAILNNAKNCLSQDIIYSSPYFSSAIYFQWRKSFFHKKQRSKWENEIKTLNKSFQKQINEQGNNTIEEKSWSEYLWWNFILQKPFPIISLKELSFFIDSLQKDFIYNMYTINSQLSILGIYLLKNK